MNNQDKKYQVVNAINSMFYRHGEGLDIEIGVKHNTVTVFIMSFNGYTNLQDGRFYVDLTASSLNTTLDIVKQQMERALKQAGAKFVTISELRGA